MGIISWVIFGALAGWVASLISGDNERQGWLGNIVVGIVGAFVGGLIYSLISDDGFEASWSIGSFIVAVIGALVVLGAMRMIRSRA